MDPRTEAIRSQYEEFPYPATAEPEIRLGAAVRLLLSYGQLQRPASRPLHCLDAGCGRGNGALGAALTQPDVQITAIDINRVVLRDAEAKARELGLKNIRFQEVDLMTLAGLEVPAGGFDVIVSSGVLHHLAAPDEGLAQLRRVLAPHGILSLMVYGTYGREPLYRMVRAIDMLIPRDRPLAERLAVAKRLAQETTAEALRVGPIVLSDRLHPNEFVDRYLNVNETSYDVASLWALLERQQFRFLRWMEPADWTLPLRTPGDVDLTAHLGELQRYQVIEQITWRHQLFLIAGTMENGPRTLPPPRGWPALHFALNPEVSLHFETRNLHGSQRAERLGYQLRARPVAPLAGPPAALLWAMRDQTTPIKGQELLRRLGASHIDHVPVLDVLAELVAREIVYCPHPTEA